MNQNLINDERRVTNKGEVGSLSLTHGNPEAADETIGRQTRSIIANLFNKQPRTADKRWGGVSGDTHNPSS